MVCPNCKHELSPYARVCPTCGTPAPAVQPVPTVVIAPPAQAPTPTKLPKKKKLTAARVFTVLFCLVAIAAACALVWAWFMPFIAVYSDAFDGNSSTGMSMYALCVDNAPYITFVVIGLCAVCIGFCLIPLFKKFSAKRNRLLIPKIATLLCGACYAFPFVWPGIVPDINSKITGWQAHVNPFTCICLGLFLLLCITAELTIRHRTVTANREIEYLKAKLAANGIDPEA